MANKRSLWGYRGDDHNPFIKVTLTDFKLLARTRTMFEKGEVDFRGMFRDQLMTYESNIPYTLRFMIDHKVKSILHSRTAQPDDFEQISGMNWLEIPAGKYEVRGPSQKISNCQIELDCSHSNLISHEPEGEWSKIAPLRILSFDIECAGRKGVFPDPEHDPVIQIANMVTRQGGPGSFFPA